MINKKIDSTLRIILKIYRTDRFCSPLTTLVFILLLTVTTDSLGQLTREPVQRRAAIRNTSSPAGRKQSTLPLQLPFWDDFSFTPIDDPADTTANYPLDSIWVNSENVWINQGVGVHAPSLNVATFDGLNSLGLPYSDVILANGLRDSLTSQPIDLSPTAVSLAERNSVFLSFFYQWQGNGEPPDKNDFFQLEFKNSSGAWEIMMTIYPKTSMSRTEFYDTIIQVPFDNDRFFYDAFQFRFDNFGRKSGPFDTWNLDYIYFDKNRTLASMSFPDRALASQPTQLFGRYTAAPLEHFRKSTPFDSIEFDVKNLKTSATEIAIGYNTYMTFRNYTGGSALADHTILYSTGGVGPNGGLMDPLERAVVRMETTPNPNDTQQFNPAADSIDIFLKINVTSGDFQDSGRPGFLPVDFRINDTLTTDYKLKDYYAYDDGTAEYSARLNTTSDRLAYAFNMLTDVVDTLIGFDVYFPDFGLSTDPTVDFQIYDDNNGMPGDLLYTISSYTLVKQGVINKFQHIKVPEVVRVRNRFYVGYTSPNVRIGLDCNNDTGDRMYVNVGGGWYQNTDVVGSLMIRPEFGKGEDNPVGIPEDPSLLATYPNPNNGEFYMDRAWEVLQVISVSGQSIRFTAEQADDRQKITLQQTIPGLYLIRVKKGTTLSAQKIIVR
ncbi:MAG TPA: T9SS type A sorting domain-containing protein [Ohtaekwangia sp.]|uniref:T9SS type A sorting domain-containing protein n=1 Tax=Ohtaekwangia sp. TaxID=2066019 RepID=UPI002F95C6C5